MEKVAGGPQSLELLESIGSGSAPRKGLKNMDELGRGVLKCCGCLGDLPDAELFAVIEEVAEEEQVDML